MTDFGRFKAVRKTYVYRMSTVCTFFALLFVGGVAQAGAWEEFEARCLVPMEEFREPVSEGMRLVRSSSSFDFFFGDEMSLQVSREDGNVTKCFGTGIEQTFNAKGPLQNTRQSFIDDAVAGLDQLVAAGRYTLIAESDVDYKGVTIERRVFHSHLWREPVLSITLQVGPTYGDATVEEINLES